MDILVVGGAGYIGSHMTRQLLDGGHRVTVFDNLSTGFRDAVGTAELVVGDLADSRLLREVLRSRTFDGVVHFASAIVVGESVTDPAKYYRINVGGTLNLLEACVETRTTRVVFSSSAAVYGNPKTEALAEDHAREPINPYGRSKHFCEQVLADYERAYGLKWVALRYFNAAGAQPDASIGERHEPETHLIPLLLRAASGRGPALTLNGTDFETPDGTCIRDYVHVCDLADAHLRAIRYLDDGGASRAMNLGNGSGFSNQQVIEAARAVTGRPIEVRKGPRREGDPARLVADSRLARSALGWTPRYPDLSTIISHAWAWERKQSS